MAERVEKVCVLCGEDCSRVPRVKNKAGRYACETCLAEAKARREAHVVAYSGGGDEKTDGLGGDLVGESELLRLEDVVGEGLFPSADRCPKCGVPMLRDAVLCVSCGHHRGSGKSVLEIEAKRSAAEMKREKARRKASGGGGFAVPGWMGLTLLIGGFVCVLGGITGAFLAPPLAVILIALVAWMFVLGAWIGLIVTAFVDGDTVWGIVGICGIAVPLLNILAMPAFALYYVIFRSQRTGWKLAFAGAVMCAGLTSIAMVVRGAEFEEGGAGFDSGSLVEPAAGDGFR